MKLKEKMLKVGILGRQILLLLEAGVALGLAHSYKRHKWILKSVPKELKKIEIRYINRAIRNLYKSKLIDFKEDKNGHTTIILNDNGKKQVLKYKIDNIKLKKQNKWDGYWRIIIFDIPQELKRERDIFAKKLKEIGMVPFQKSVFVYPYECKDELNFIIEFYNLRPYVRFGLLKEIDNELHLKKIFDLI
ncbi:MAG: hypothetical protein KatS3mg096_002 [Candidatus Parcubacteria bacterium]|nr:MAG: hypothetical protein KatS3mg096_002 [Candidatus Parcubacteria bacterium]